MPCVLAVLSCNSVDMSSLKLGIYPSPNHDPRTTSTQVGTRYMLNKAVTDVHLNSCSL